MLIDETQTKDVLNHLKEHGSITQLEATELYGATRLSAIIFNLRHWHGYVIDTVIETGTNRHGRKCRFGRYFLDVERSANRIFDRALEGDQSAIGEVAESLK